METKRVLARYLGEGSQGQKRAPLTIAEIVAGMRSVNAEYEALPKSVVVKPKSRLGISVKAPTIAPVFAIVGEYFVFNKYEYSREAVAAFHTEHRDIYIEAVYEAYRQIAAKKLRTAYYRKFIRDLLPTVRSILLYVVNCADDIAAPITDPSRIQLLDFVKANCARNRDGAYKIYWGLGYYNKHTHLNNLDNVYKNMKAVIPRLEDLAIFEQVLGVLLVNAETENAKLLSFAAKLLDENKKIWATMCINCAALVVIYIMHHRNNISVTKEWMHIRESLEITPTIADIAAAIVKDMDHNYSMSLIVEMLVDISRGIGGGVSANKNPGPEPNIASLVVGKITAILSHHFIAACDHNSKVYWYKTAVARAIGEYVRQNGPSSRIVDKGNCDKLADTKNLELGLVQSAVRTYGGMSVFAQYYSLFTKVVYKCDYSADVYLDGYRWSYEPNALPSSAFGGRYLTSLNRRYYFTQQPSIMLGIEVIDDNTTVDANNKIDIASAIAIHAPNSRSGVCITDTSSAKPGSSIKKCASAIIDTRAGWQHRKKWHVNNTALSENAVIVGVESTVVADEQFSELVVTRSLDILHHVTNIACPRRTEEFGTQNRNHYIERPDFTLANPPKNATPSKNSTTSKYVAGPEIVQDRNGRQLCTCCDSELTSPADVATCMAAILFDAAETEQHPWNILHSFVMRRYGTSLASGVKNGAVYAFERFSCPTMACAVRFIEYLVKRGEVAVFPFCKVCMMNLNGCSLQINYVDCDRSRLIEMLTSPLPTRPVQNLYIVCHPAPYIYSVYGGKPSPQFEQSASWKQALGTDNIIAAQYRNYAYSKLR